VHSLGLLPHHTTDEIAAFRRALATLINTLPEGDDLWKQLSTSWDTRLDLLRSLTETTDEVDPADYEQGLVWVAQEFASSVQTSSLLREEG